MRSPGITSGPIVTRGGNAGQASGDPRNRAPYEAAGLASPREAGLRRVRVGSSVDEAHRPRRDPDKLNPHVDPSLAPIPFNLIAKASPGGRLGEASCGAVLV